VVVAGLCLTLAGCGGGGEEPAAPAEAPAEVPAAPAAETPTDEGPELSPPPEQVFEPFPTDESVVPDEIAARLESGQPMIIFFYDEDQTTTDDQRAEVERVVEDYRGLIDQVAYNVAKYVTFDADGTIEIKPEMAEDQTANRIAKLAGSDYLGITFTPYLVLVDSQGYITHRFRGPIDAESLEREVLRATD
jgi:hypothetical protein